MIHCFEGPFWLDLRQLTIENTKAQMELVIAMSRENVERETGGPFGAAVFAPDGRLVGVGVNRVMPENASMLHAEMMALMSAHKNESNWNLTGFRLVTSCQPCAMCFGAILWSGVSEMIYGATATDARAIGFDEGPLVSNWRDEMEKRRVQVIGPVMRSEAAAVLNAYANASGTIYNPD